MASTFSLIYTKCIDPYVDDDGECSLDTDGDSIPDYKVSNSLVPSPYFPFDQKLTYLLMVTAILPQYNNCRILVQEDLGLTQEAVVSQLQTGCSGVSIILTLIVTLYLLC